MAAMMTLRRMGLSINVKIEAVFFRPAVRGSPFAIFINVGHGVVSCVQRRVGRVKQDLFILGKELLWALLGYTCTVVQLSLKQRKVGLQKWNNKRPEWKICSLLKLSMKFFDRQMGIHES